MMQLRRLLFDGAVMLRMCQQRVDLPSGACHCSGDVCVPDVCSILDLLVSQEACRCSGIPAASDVLVTACSADGRQKWQRVR
jgi:hypothetical protein